MPFRRIQACRFLKHDMLPRFDGVSGVDIMRGMDRADVHDAHVLCLSARFRILLTL